MNDLGGVGECTHRVPLDKPCVACAEQIILEVQTELSKSTAQPTEGCVKIYDHRGSCRAPSSAPYGTRGCICLEGAEAINHPAHYGGDTTYEAIKVIEAWKLGFCLGNTVKYIRRADSKGAALEDLKKARWYLDREIKKREES